MHPGARIAAFILASHALRYASEWVYWHNCAGFMSSVFASGSQSCKALRYVSELSSANILTVAGSYALKTIGA
jgi:hypothetical protein